MPALRLLLAGALTILLAQAARPATDPEVPPVQSLGSPIARPVGDSRTDRERTAPAGVRGVAARR